MPDTQRGAYTSELAIFVADNTSRSSAGPALTNKEKMRALGLTGGRAQDSKKVAARGILGAVERALRDPRVKKVAKGRTFSSLEKSHVNGWAQSPPQA